jgi:anti-sigma B factor antagonist
MDIKQHGNVKIAQMPVRFDAQTSREVEKVLQEVLESGTNIILCNLAQTEYISSAGLRVLLAVAKNLKKAEGQLCLCSTNTFVQEVLETSGLTTIFKIFKSEEDALKNLSS